MEDSTLSDKNLPDLKPSDFNVTPTNPKKTITKPNTDVPNGKYLLPRDYEQAYKELVGSQPKQILRNSYSTHHYALRMFRRIMSIIEFENYPKGWDIEYLKKIFFRRGYIGFFNTKAYGVVPLECSYYGNNIYHRPTNLILTNEHVKPSLSYYTIGKDCTLMHLQHNYQGVNSLIDQYATKISNIDASIEVNLQNSKVTAVFVCDDKRQSETAKKIYDDIARGEPAVFPRKAGKDLNANSGFDVQFLPVKNSYLVNDLLDAKNTFSNAFFNDIGISANAVDKKERVNTIESSSNFDQILNSINDWKENIERGISEMNDLFKLKVRVTFPYLDSLKRSLNEGRMIDEFGEGLY